MRKLMCNISIESAKYICKQGEATVAPKLKGSEPLLSVQNI